MIYQLIFEATLFLLYYYYSLLLQFIRERIRIIFRLRTSLHIRLAAHIKPQGSASLMSAPIRMTNRHASDNSWNNPRRSP